MTRLVRKPHQRKRDLEIIERLSLQGLSEVGIAERLQEITQESYLLTQQQISDALSKVRKRWREEPTGDLLEERNRMISENNAVKQEYWIAWHKSQQEAKTKSIKNKGGTADAKAGGALEKTLRTEERDGDPRYLQGVERCLERYARLMGLEKPQKIAFTDPQGEEQAGVFSERELKRRFMAIVETVGGLEAFISDIEK